MKIHNWELWNQDGLWKVDLASINEWSFLCQESQSSRYSAVAVICCITNCALIFLSL
jgi:hypothetical protein